MYFYITNMIIMFQLLQLLTKLPIIHQSEGLIELMTELIEPMLLDGFLNILSFTKYNYHSNNIHKNNTAYNTRDSSI